jgi:hypothetical protein
MGARPPSGFGLEIPETDAHRDARRMAFGAISSMGAVAAVSILTQGDGRPRRSSARFKPVDPSRAVSGRKALGLVELILVDRPMPSSNDCHGGHIPSPAGASRRCVDKQRMSVRWLVDL